MSRRRESDQNDRCPQTRCFRSKDDRYHCQSGNQHGCLTARVDRESALEQERREPSSANAADGGHCVNHKERKPHVGKSDSVRLEEKVRKPEQIEPPDRIGHELTDGKCPGLRVWYQLQPGNFGPGLRWFTANIVQFCFAYP